MRVTEMEELLKSQRRFFKSGATLSVDFRIRMLKRLRAVVLRHEGEILRALREDLGKSGFEAYMCEIGMLLHELSYMLNHVEKFAKPHRVKTPLAQFPAISYTKPSPYGTTLIMSPWNYPFLLTMGPLADAIAAGNTAIVKPSAYAPATGEVVKKVIEEAFPGKYIAVVLGGREENRHLLGMKFDFIFFTGSQAVGKEVLRAAADHLTPVVLELGGKSPCIVDNTAKIKLAAKRIVFGKLINCGQTCVAPDYILCQKDIKEELLKEIIRQIERQYGKEALKNPRYGKIINRKHFERISNLIDRSKVVYGGRVNGETLQMEPVVMDGVTWEDKVMQEEIFGPVFPILTFEKIEQVYDMLKDLQQPLALYIFSENEKNIRMITERCRFGGGCINDTIIHLATTEMGFGGVGESGMGAYHGKTGFDAFSHTKSMVNKKTWLDLPMRYQPYRKIYEGLVRFFLQ